MQHKACAVWRGRCAIRGHAHLCTPPHNVHTYIPCECMPTSPSLCASSPVPLVFTLMCTHPFIPACALHMHMHLHFFCATHASILPCAHISLFPTTDPHPWALPARGYHSMLEIGVEKDGQIHATAALLPHHGLARFKGKAGMWQVGG